MIAMMIIKPDRQTGQGKRRKEGLACLLEDKHR